MKYKKNIRGAINCDNVGSYFRRWCGAFTLAEVLITLGIIGVVVAMTMPTLINNYQKKLAVTRLKHFSSMMQQAAKMRDKDIMEGDFVEMQIK